MITLRWVRGAVPGILTILLEVTKVKVYLRGYNIDGMIFFNLNLTCMKKLTG
jgi:hypothetical protein